MSIATVVLRGYGTGSYADVNKLPTLGYSSGAAAATPTGRMEYTVPRSSMEYTVTRSGMEYGVQQ